MTKSFLDEFLKEDKNKRNSGIINPEGNWIKDFFDWSEDEIQEFLNANVQEFAKDCGNYIYMGIYMILKKEK